MPETFKPLTLADVELRIIDMPKNLQHSLHQPQGTVTSLVGGYEDPHHTSSSSAIRYIAQ